MSNKIFRETKQRNAIKRAIERAGRPVGPKEILELACGEVPNLGIATVYRNIKTMVEKGELDPVDLPGQAPRYQPPQDKKPHLF
ncbi:MAG: transcriptional repressor, partial [Opitutales bacterium]